jgi:hypothetical protein
MLVSLCVAKIYYFLCLLNLQRISGVKQTFKKFGQFWCKVKENFFAEELHLLFGLLGYAAEQSASWQPCTCTARSASKRIFRGMPQQETR